MASLSASSIRIAGITCLATIEQNGETESGKTVGCWAAIERRVAIKNGMREFSVYFWDAVRTCRIRRKGSRICIAKAAE